MGFSSGKLASIALMKVLSGQITPCGGRGAYLKTGAGAPDTTDPPGHLYLDTSSYDVYQSTGEVFKKLAFEE